LLRHCSPAIEAAEMPDCLRNGLCRCGWIAKIGRNYLDIDIGRPHKGSGDVRKLCRVAGNDAKMHAFSGEFGRYGGPIPGYQCNFPLGSSSIFPA
jgi:hypothetical protein